MYLLRTISVRAPKVGATGKHGNMTELLKFRAIT